MKQPVIELSHLAVDAIIKGEINYLWSDVSAEDCYRTKLGRGYNGKVNVTASGRDCQPWGSHQPHAHNFTWLWTEENFCRNPDDRANGPWCYTMDPETVLESCGISQCSKFPHF
uniref:Plasminogen n=1 Tax=Magallana gigas TaxID=29159 RepID=K1Q4J9_MAGGI